MPKGISFDTSVLIALIATPQTAREVLAAYGVAIVPSLLSQEKCDTLLSKMWDFFEEISAKMPVPVKRNDSGTWATLLQLCTHHCMLFQHYGVGHAEFMWWVRQQPEVYGVFSHIWDVPAEDLLVSFDGASFMAPPDRLGNPRPKAGWGSPKHWFHQDQSLRAPDFKCIQGWVTPLAVEPGDATLCVMAKSHLLSREISKQYPHLVGPADWVRFDDNMVAFLAKHGCSEVRIECPPGSLVLWDSRTAHYGAPPIPGRSAPKFRAVCYVSFLPRSGATDRDLVKKVQAFDARRTTSHWAYPVRMFPKAVRSYGAPPPNVVPARAPDLSELGKIFAGIRLPHNKQAASEDTARSQSSQLVSS